MNDVESSGPIALRIRRFAKRRPLVAAGFALGALAALAAVIVANRSLPPGNPDSRTGRSGPGAAMPAVPVGVATASRGEIDVYQNALGTVVPRNVVTVHTRVDGELLRVLFKEGQIVHRGDLLAQIDPRPYQVQLTQARGQMERDRALLKNAEVDLRRYKTLLAQDSISQQQVDTQAALVRQYQGNVLADQGQVDGARLSLTYTRVTAPLTGRVGLRLVDPGNMVHATDANGLVVITQVQPMTVVFAVPETKLAAIVPRLYAGETFQVDAWDRDDRVKLASGTLSAADNQIDPATGTVKLRAQFRNERSLLFPNEFVNARVLVARRRDATIVPAAAIQVGNEGAFVYVVRPDHKVAVRNVTPGPSDGDRVAIDRGVAPGEIVVVDGTDRLRDGVVVRPVSHNRAGAGKSHPGRG